MADTTRYVNIASTAGGDGTTNGTAGATRAYASASEWEAAEQGTIGSGDRHLVYLDDGGSGADTTAFNIAGWTVTGELHLIGNSGGDNASYDGTASSGYRITGADSQNGIIDVDEDNVFFDGFELYFTGGNAYTYYDQACIKPSSNCNLCTVQNMLMWSDSTSHSTHGIYKDRSGGDVTVENTVVFGMGTAGFTGESTFTPYLNQDWIITNCSIYDCGWDSGYLLNGGATHMQIPSGHDVSMTINHCLLHANGSAADVCSETGGGTSSYSGDYNISNRASAGDQVPGGNSLFSRTWTASASPGTGDWVMVLNITGGSEDFHIRDDAENDAQLGSSSGTYTSTDLEGTTRGTDPDIGAYQITTGGGGGGDPTPLRMMMGMGS